MMNIFWEVGIAWILWLQRFSPALDAPMVIVTMLGEMAFYALLIPTLYWCLDRRLGFRLALLLLLSFWTNTWAKAILAQPRPYEVDPRVRVIRPASGGGLPSGHTQNTVVVWGAITTWVQRPWATVLFGVLLVLVPLSRMYLGVHFPTDLVGGYLLGAGLLWLYWRSERAISKAFMGLPLGWRLFLAGGLGPLLLLTMPPQQPYLLEAAWLLSGAGMGVVLERQWVRQAEPKGLARCLFCWLLGAASSGGLFGLIQALSSWAHAPTAACALYLPLGLWLTAGVPWMFLRLKLALQEKPSFFG